MDLGERRPGISATIITRDAEATLEETLSSLSWVDEIVVVDSGSRDATREIARRHGARVLVRDWPGYGAQKDRAMREASHDWILWVDADEVVTPELARAMQRALADPGNRAGFRMVRHTRFLDRWIGSRGWWTEWKLRLFRRDLAYFEQAPVHEGLHVRGPVESLEGVLLHRQWLSVQHRLEKYNRYASLEAEMDWSRGRRCPGVRPFLWAASWFLKVYLKRGGFLYGRAGLTDAGMVAAYAFQRGVKLQEIWRERGAPSAGPLATAAR